MIFSAPRSDNRRILNLSCSLRTKMKRAQLDSNAVMLQWAPPKDHLRPAESKREPTNGLAILSDRHGASGALNPAVADADILVSTTHDVRPEVSWATHGQTSENS